MLARLSVAEILIVGVTVRITSFALFAGLTLSSVSGDVCDQRGVVMNDSSATATHAIIESFETRILFSPFLISSMRVDCRAQPTPSGSLVIECRKCLHLL